ncbi:hypothetical protein D9M72_499130 [compost metagenome]
MGRAAGAHHAHHGQGQEPPPAVRREARTAAARGRRTPDRRRRHPADREHPRRSRRTRVALQRRLRPHRCGSPGCGPDSFHTRLPPPVPGTARSTRRQVPPAVRRTDPAAQRTAGPRQGSCPAPLAPPGHRPAGDHPGRTERGQGLRPEVADQRCRNGRRRHPPPARERTGAGRLVPLRRRRGDAVLQ